MSKIIEFPDPNRPDLIQTIDGEKWFKFNFEYEFYNSRFTVDFWARNTKEAEERFAAIKNNGSNLVQIYSEFPA